MAFFKILAVLLVASAALLVSCRRPRLGGTVLHFGCAATGAVVLYSCYLALHGSAYASLARDARAADDASRKLDQHCHLERNYQALLRQLSHDVIAGRQPFWQAVNELANSEKNRNTFWLGLLRQTYSGRTDLECVALHLAFHALGGVDDDPALKRELRQRLERDFRAVFGTEVSFACLRTDNSPDEGFDVTLPVRSYSTH